MKRLFGYIGRYIPAGVFVLIFAAVSVAFSLYIPVLTGRAVDLLTVGPGNIDMDAVIAAAGKVGIAALISAFFQYLMSRLGNHITYHVVSDIRNDAMKKIQELQKQNMKLLMENEYLKKLNALVSEREQREQKK